MRKLNICKVVIFISLNYLITLGLYAQFTDNDKANAYYDQNKYKEAIPYFENVVKSGNKKDRIDASDKLATCYRIMGDFDKSIYWYEKLIKIDKKNSEYVKKYAIALKNASRFDDATKQFEVYKRMEPNDPTADNLIESCRLAEEWLSEALINPQYTVKINEIISTNASEYSPVFYKNKVVFSSNREGATKRLIDITGSGDEILNDLYITDFYDSVQKVRNFKEVNTPEQEGPATFSDDGKIMFYTTTVKGKRDKKTNQIKTTLQIWYRQKNEQGNWSNPSNILDFNSFDYSIGHPTLSQDGKKLFFMSDMPGGFGDADIYVSHYDEITKKWGKPENLGEHINTKGNELFPFIYQNNTLFFSSDFHPGMGRLDIFFSTFENGEWSKPENMKPPINTVSDDLGICIDKESFRGFYSTDHFEDMIEMDNIRSFIKKEPFMLTFKGENLQIKDQALYNGINFYMTDEESGIMDYEFLPKEGLYNFSMPENTRYRLDVREGIMRRNSLSIIYSENKDVDKKEHKVKIKIEANQQNQDEFFVRGYLSITNPKDSIQDPIIGANVNLICDNNLMEQTKSGNEGAYKFKTTLEKGKNYLIISEGGRLEIKKRIVYLNGIISYRNTPVNDVSLSIYLNGNIVNEIKTNEIGEYTCDINPETNYQIIINKENYKTDTIEVSSIGAKPFSNLIKNIEIKKNIPDVIAKGNITDQDKSPINDATIKITDKNNNIIAQTKSSESGNINISLEPNNEYKLIVEKENYITQNINLKTTEASEINIPNVVMRIDKKALKANAEKPLIIEGIVVDKNNDKYLENVYVDIRRSGQLLESLMTDSLGQFKTSIPKGYLNEYYISFDKKKYIHEEFKIDKNNTETIKVVKLLPENQIENNTIDTNDIIAETTTEIAPIEEEIRPVDVPEFITYKGTIENIDLENDNIEIIAMQGQDIVEKTKTNIKGEFSINLSPEQEYQIIIKNNDYIEKEISVSTQNLNSNDTINEKITVEKTIIQKEITITEPEIIEIPQPNIPENIEYECSVINNHDNSPVDNCFIMIISKGENIASGTTDNNGIFKTKLPLNKDYTVILRKDHYRGMEVGISTHNQLPQNTIKDEFKLEKEVTTDDLIASKLMGKQEKKQEQVNIENTITQQPIHTTKEEPLTQTQETPIQQPIITTKEEPLTQTQETPIQQPIPPTPKEEPLTQTQETPIQQPIPPTPKEEPLTQTQETPIQQPIPPTPKEEPLTQTQETPIQQPIAITPKEEIIQKEELFIDNINNQDIIKTITPDSPTEPKKTITNNELKENIINISGTITDAENKPLDSTQILIAEKTEIINQTITNKEGKYSVDVPANNQYELISTTKGHFQNEKKINVNNENIINDEKLQKIQLNQPKEIKNIYFDLNSTVLKKESKFELDKLYNFLIINDNIAVKINSHTDARGSEEYNMKLSQQRSIASVTYLIGKGIGKTRLIPMAYGESILLIKNATTENEHQKNRRTEFEIVALDYHSVPDTASLYNIAIEDIDTKINEKQFKDKRNIVYKVQLGASKVNLEKNFFDKLKDKLGDIEIVEYESKASGVFKYNTGEFNNLKDAIVLQNKIIQSQAGFDDAFIVAFDGDKEIPDSELNKYLRYEAQQTNDINQDIYNQTNIPTNQTKYSVQVGASKIAVQKGIFKKIENAFPNINITYKKYDDGYFRYNAGMFDNINEAKQLCTEIHQLGMQAFIVKFVNGQRELIQENIITNTENNYAQQEQTTSQNNNDENIEILLENYFNQLPANNEIAYSIQVGAFLKPVKKHLTLLQSIENINPDAKIMFYHDNDGFYKCLKGYFYNKNEAINLLNNLKQQQFQAFIVTIKNGKRIN